VSSDSDYDPATNPENDMTPIQEDRVRLADAPKGTLALMLIVFALLLVGWALLYFGRFLENGPVR
jgi:hypothetical protein